MYSNASWKNNQPSTCIVCLKIPYPPPSLRERASYSGRLVSLARPAGCGPSQPDKMKPLTTLTLSPFNVCLVCVVPKSSPPPYSPLCRSAQCAFHSRPSLKAAKESSVSSCAARHILFNILASPMSAILYQIPQPKPSPTPSPRPRAILFFRPRTSHPSPAVCRGVGMNLKCRCDDF